MTAVAAAELRVDAAARDEPDEVPGGEAEGRVFEQSASLWRSEETVAAMTRVLDQPVPPRHFVRAVPEQITEVANFLPKRRTPYVVAPSVEEEEGVPALLADEFAVSVAASGEAVAVAVKEAGDDVPDSGVGTVLTKNP